MSNENEVEINDEDTPAVKVGVIAGGIVTNVNERIIAVLDEDIASINQEGVTQEIVDGWKDVSETIDELIDATETAWAYSSEPQPYVDEEDSKEEDDE